jgi:hypothetical protein
LAVFRHKEKCAGAVDRFDDELSSWPGAEFNALAHCEFLVETILLQEPQQRDWDNGIINDSAVMRPPFNPN